MKRILITVASILLLGGCYPGGAEYAEDTDVVYTIFDEEYDFQSSSTYAMPDRIVVDVDIDDGDTSFVYMRDIFSEPILASIADNMESLGWTRVDIEDGPDVLLTPAAIESTTYFYSYWYDWWYGGWYGGYWGWYYPPYYTVSSYTTGTMVMTISDPNMASESPINKSPSVWVSAANGLFTGNYNIDRVTESIEQSFKQSPYLNIN
jgi:Domain of unknown function (DUF4136)